MKKALVLFVALGLIAALIAGCGSTQTKSPDAAKTVKVFKLANDGAPDHPIAQGLAMFADEVGKASKGNLKIDVFNNGQLGQEKDAVEGVKLGTIQLTKANCGNITGYVKELNAFTLPFIFRDMDHNWKVLNGPIGDSIRQKFEANGFKLLCFLEEGARYVYSSKLVNTPDDFKGMKIRTMAAASIQDGFKALGASPTPMNTGEVYSALEQGVIDAAENNLGVIYSMKHFEVAKKISDTAHLRIPSALIMSMKEWNKLSPEEQKMFQDAANKASEWEKKKYTEDEKGFKEKLLAAGVQFNTIDDATRAKFIKLCEPVFEQYKGILGKELIEGIINTK